MEEQDDIEKELSELAPDFPKKNALQPPDGYFEQLPDAILTRWKKEAIDKQDQRTRRIRLISLAACLIAAVIGMWHFWPTQIHSSSWDEITQSDVLDYMEANIHEFSQLIETEDIFSQPVILSSQDSLAMQEYLLEEYLDNDLEELF